MAGLRIILNRAKGLAKSFGFILEGPAKAHFEFSGHEVLASNVRFLTHAMCPVLALQVNRRCPVDFTEDDVRGGRQCNGLSGGMDPYDHWQPHWQQLECLQKQLKIGFTKRLPKQLRSERLAKLTGARPTSSAKFKEAVTRQPSSYTTRVRRVIR